MIRAFIVGDAEVVARLRELPQKIERSLVRTVTRLSIELTRRVKEGKLSGQALKRKTGTLSRSINPSVYQGIGRDSIMGQVGTNVSYAALHEYGFNGTEQVKEHLRTLKQAFGRPITPRQVVIQAHTRKVDYPERSFLRSALSEMRQEIVDELGAAAKDALR